MKSVKLATMCGAAALMAGWPAAPATAQTPFIGQLMQTGYTFCPRGWAEASGQLLAVSQNDALFSLLGTIYGGDGRTTFGLPDLRGRTPLHQGTGPGLSPRPIGQKGGQVNVTLTTLQMPAHSHTGTINVSRTDATTRSPANAYFARTAGLTYEENTAPTGDTMHAGVVQTDNTGGSQSHTNMQPYMTMRWCIALQGIYPSRN